MKIRAIPGSYEKEFSGLALLDVIFNRGTGNENSNE